MYWFMGIVAALLLFVSVLLHELSHSLVARMKKIKVESITLFFFGGVAGIESDDLKPDAEFQMAIAGPLFSLLLGGLFFLIYRLDGNGVVTAITFYLYQLNLILAVFNLIPGFPLDGGRALRAVLHAYFKDIKKATKIAAAGGKFFAVVLIILGTISLLNGLGNGLWFIFLGAFLYFIARVSYEQVLVKDVLSKIPLSELVRAKESKRPLAPEMKFRDFIKKFVHSEEEVFFVGDKNFSGILDLRKIEKLPVRMQEIVTLKQISLPSHQFKSLQKDDTAYTAFRKMVEQDMEMLPVMEKKKVIGMVTRNAVMHCLTWNLRFGYEKSKDAKRLVRRVRKS